jgi:hypothetical protein
MSLSPHLETEKDPVSDTFVFSNYSEIWTMDEVQKHGDSECYTPLSEQFTFFFNLQVFDSI